MSLSSAAVSMSGGDRPAGQRPAPPDRRASMAGGLADHWWFLLVWIAAAAVLVTTDTGRMVFDTKLGVDIDPAGFLARLWPLWNPRELFGTLQDQYIGYAFPMAPFYLLGQLLHVPVWLTERLWMSTLITAGFAGLARLAAALRIGTPGTRMLGAAMFVLWPAFTIVIGSTSADDLPGLLVPWAILPLVSAVRGRLRPGRAAAWSGLAIVAMSGINAASTIAALVLPALYILMCSRRQHRAELSLKWAAAVVAATSWWLIPLLLQGRYSFNFLPYVEQTATTAKTMSASAVLRGAGFWTAYFNLGRPWLTAGWSLVTSPFAILASGLAAGCGLFGLARRDMPERRWLLTSVGLAAALMLAGYYGPAGGPLHSVVNTLFDGPLAPFRSLYKLEQVLAVALALGCAHALAILWRRTVTVTRTMRLTAGSATAPLAALVLAGLALPALSGQILQPGSFSQVPGYWYQTARFLAVHSPRATALLVPAAAHGEYTWGETIDDPMEPLASSPWAALAGAPLGGAGAQVVLETIEQAVESGGQVPGLPAYLARAGIRYLVIRNDLSPALIGYVNPQVVNETVRLSGFERVASFGPRVPVPATYPSLPGLVPGYAGSYPAVEIYQASDPADRPASPVAALPVSKTVLVNGGPDSLLQLAAQGTIQAGDPTVIAGQSLASRPALWAVTDGQRRADDDFGLTDNNLSFTYTAAETNPPDDPLGGADAPPRQILPVPAAGHQTVAVLSGAAQVTASSYGSWLEESPQYDPVNAFDGNPATAWAEGDPTTPAGQWIQIKFTHPVDLPAAVGIQLLDDSAQRSVANQLLVTTARGQARTDTAATAAAQPLRTPPGPTSWLRITIESASNVVPGAPGAGISDVSIPGVRVTRFLQPAEDPAGAAAPSVDYSFAQPVSTPYGATSVPAPVAMSRVFRTPSPGLLSFAAVAAPQPGPALEALISQLAPHRPRTLQISASSSLDSISQLGPQNLVDPRATEPWIASPADPHPSLDLRWHGARMIREIILTPATGLAAEPATVEIASPAGIRLATVGLGGVVNVRPGLRTDRIRLSFSQVPASTAGSTATGQPANLPLGLARISIPALHGITASRPLASAAFSLRCGLGPSVQIDGHRFPTSVRGTVGALERLLPVTLTLCTPGGRVDLAAGMHRLQAAPSAAFTVTGLSLSAGPAAQSGSGPVTQAGSGPASPSRPVAIESWQPDSRTVTIGPGQRSYLEIHQNFNQGWTATLNGHQLTAATLDGWQQAFIVPAGQGGVVTISFAPASIYHLGLLVSALAVAALLAAAAGITVPLRRRRRTGLGDGQPGPLDSIGPQQADAQPGSLDSTRPQQCHARPGLPDGTGSQQAEAQPGLPASIRPELGDGKADRDSSARPGAGAGVRTGFARRWHTLPGPVRVCAALVPPAAVLFLAGGPAAIFVPALYLAYRWRSRWAPGIALIAMAAAGLASAATAQPNAFGAGPFGPAAQLLALLALAAALTPSAPGGS